MTKFNIYSKIIRGNRLKNGDFKFKVEVLAEAVRIKPPTLCESYSVRKKTYKMTELKANLLECSNYLIQLFYQTNQKYSCSRTKIGKLLSIVSFVYARKGQMLFDESVFKYDGCGTAINELKAYIDRDVYMQYSYSDDCSFIEDTLMTPGDIPEKYQNIDNLTDELKATILKVFRHFGAYSAYELGMCLNSIVNHKGMTNLDGSINLCGIYALQKSDFEQCANGTEHHCELINFLF